jgi:hypothetical protein
MTQNSAAMPERSTAQASSRRVEDFAITASPFFAEACPPHAR